jgi:hypothetical protein
MKQVLPRLLNPLEPGNGPVNRPDSNLRLLSSRVNGSFEADRRGFGANSFVADDGMCGANPFDSMGDADASRLL